ncbi:MAG: tRNA threonylcarbamoyladenosine dehydratase [Firmicutes bacterium]|nr:tRNA threonylcarbamoyladenosine dehydratase [Bacillota bacterium]
MKKEQYSRIEALMGSEALEKLRGARVIVFGIGGVGGHVVEALARSGVGALDLVDKDVVSLSNLNRQIIALRSTVGRSKVEVMKERIADIDPDCVVRTYQMLYLPETADQFDFTQYDYVVDAIDTVAAKIDLVLKAREAGVPVICSMGTGNKLDPTQLEVADISKTSVCPLAKAVRTQLKKRGVVKGVKVVYSKELPRKPSEEFQSAEGERTPASVAFVPSVAGLIIAGEVIKDMTGEV